MNLLDSVLLGLDTVLQWPQLILLAIGCLCGAMAVAAPRVGLLSMLAMLLPVVQQIEMLPALMLFIGIYCGASGGLAASFAVARAEPQTPVPARTDGIGTLHIAPPSIVNTAPPVALLAGLLGSVAMVVIGPLLIEQAFHFGPAEYFSLIACGLIASVVLAPDSLIKAMSTLVLGVMLSQLGVDPQSSLARFHFDLGELEPGLGLIPLALGLAVVARQSAPVNGRAPAAATPSEPVVQSARFVMRHQWAQLLRGVGIGSMFGLLPGGVRLGRHVASAVEDDSLRRDGAVGADPIDNAGAPAATTAAVRSSLVPLLALGFPVNASLALLVGVMLGKQVVVGPQLMTGQPVLFWGAIAAIALASVLMFVGARPLARLARASRNATPAWLSALLVIYCCIGAYTLRFAAFDIFVMAAFALLGHWLIKFGCRVGPLILGFVLGPALESHLRHALELSGGEWGVLITRPISAGLLLVAAMLVCAVMLPSVRLRRARVFELED